MLQAGKIINANIGADDGIMLTVGGGVNQRSRASPVFVRCMREENLRDDTIRRSTVEQAALLMRERIDLRLIGEGKNIGREKYGRGRLCIARRLREAIVKIAAPCPGAST